MFNLIWYVSSLNSLNVFVVVVVVVVVVFVVVFVVGVSQLQLFLNFNTIYKIQREAAL